MPIRSVPGTEYSYFLIIHDEEGRERPEPGGAMLSRAALDTIRDEPVTDVFVMSHGWRGDIPKAIRQYDRWTANLMAQDADLARMRQVRPGFEPVLIGLHWPSEPWGDEEVAAFGVATGAVGKLVDDFAARLGGDAEVRRELQTIVEAYATVEDPPELPAEVADAYERLDRRLAMGAEGAGAAPGADRPPFDPEDVYQAARQQDTDAGSFGLLESTMGGILAPLRVLSFWRMKNRARLFGEGGAHALLEAIHGVGRPVRVHLMGHSFGSIVVSAMTAGPAGGAAAGPPVHSLVLVQGALSLWSYAASIPVEQGAAGYFARILSENRVSGPIVTTQSEYDTAVGRAYPLAAGLRRQVAFGELPKYGAVGTFGLQGLASATGRRIGGAGESYGFCPGRVYNLESSKVIREISGAAGAHNDIAHPEVAHAMWEAALGVAP